MRLSGYVWLAIGLAAAACGGSSSESPWPIEPLDAEPGPFGEKPPAGDATDVTPVPEPEVEEADAGTEFDEELE